MELNIQGGAGGDVKYKKGLWWSGKKDYTGENGDFNFDVMRVPVYW